MKHPKVNQAIVFIAYGIALAIGYHNVEMTAIGLAVDPENIAPMDWMLSVGMAMFELALSGALTTPSFWPTLLGSSTAAIDGILGLGEDSKKYQFMALGLLIFLVAALVFATTQVYRWDILTTEAAIYPSQGEPSEIEIFKVYALVFGPEALLLGAGLLSLASGISKVQWNQIQGRSEQLAAHYSDPYSHGAGPDLNA